ncbi:excinuclease ABC subunit UvrA, partial [bacterium]|nr:excinuclease ABC subunit UvrA [bacterium]MBU1025730.1 excinuclease ABC subunit UvrA [bacterium]
AISIDQKSASRNPRSTVGTVTEIYDYLRLLFARAGTPHCTECGKPIVRQSAQEIVDQILDLEEDTRFYVLAPVVRNKKGTFTKLFIELAKEGFSRVRADGDIYLLTDDIELERYGIHNVEVVVDRLVMKKDIRQRLAESVELSLKRADGLVIIHIVDEEKDITFSEHFSCAECGISFGEITPKLFSFNSPYGACEVCNGLGVIREIDPELVIDKNRSLYDEAIMPWRGTSSGYLTSVIHAAANAIGIDPYKPLNNVQPEKVQELLYGSDEKIVIEFTWVSMDGDERHAEMPFSGVIPYLNRRFRETTSDYIRNMLEQYMSSRPCLECNGKKLKPQALSVKFGGLDIIEVTDKTVVDLLKFFSQTKLTSFQKKIADQVMKEIKARLTFMDNVGLNYITLSRSAVTLSSGESQRIRLATQIGSNLTGVLYILDEPTIGLHQRDNARLIGTLKNLRDLGNTVIVVEHDEETIMDADHIIDLGPGAGEDGGHIVAEGKLDQVINTKGSPTGQFLKIKTGYNGATDLYKKKFRKSQGELIIRNPRHNNLKGKDVKIPLGCFVAVSGVSGSGKSSLINETLYRQVAHHFNLRTERPGANDGVDGINQLENVIVVNQSPIGRTPRSNPATYTKTFDKIRQLFAQTKESKIRGYQPGRFSFNVKGGRCESCQGDGVIKIEMHFLPDVYVKCEACDGKRYNRETLQVEYKGKNIADVLNMTVNTAVEFFGPVPAIRDKIQVLQDVGLGYIRLGQQATTLSGGEAQRVKLALELSKKKVGKTLYILDEPTTGLHYFDVQKLLGVLNRLIDRGNTVVIIEHNLDVLANADYIIDLGPEGGDAGGRLIASGTPRQIAKSKKSYTGQYLKELFSRENRNNIKMKRNKKNIEVVS